MVRSCSAMSLAELRDDIERFTLEAERLRYEASQRRGWAEEALRLLANTGKKRQLETGDVEEGDYETFSRQEAFLLQEAEAFVVLVRELEEIERRWLSGAGTSTRRAK